MQPSALSACQTYRAAGFTPDCPFCLSEPRHADSNVMSSDSCSQQLTTASLYQALEKGAAEAHGEWVPFAARLAQRMASLVQAGSLAVGSPLWNLLLEHILLRLIDSDLQVTSSFVLLLCSLPPCFTPLFTPFLVEPAAARPAAPHQFRPSGEVTRSCGWLRAGGGCSPCAAWLILVSIRGCGC